jgi:hypothetical protein
VLRALTCSPPQRAFVRTVSLGLQISERRLGADGARTFVCMTPVAVSHGPLRADCEFNG